MPNLRIEPFPFGIDRSIRVWDGMIKRFGGPALLRQHGIPDRYVTAMSSNFTAMERLGGLGNPTERKMLVSIISPETDAPVTPEPSERDVLVTLILDASGVPALDAGGNPIEDELLTLFTPPVKVGPSTKELYWKLLVRA